MQFSSVKEAASWAGITANQISKVLSGIRKTAGGYCWKLKE